MTGSVGQIATRDRNGLVALWGEVIGGPVPKRPGRPFLRRILAFEVHARPHCGLPATMRRKLASIAAGRSTPSGHTALSDNVRQPRQASFRWSRGRR